MPKAVITSFFPDGANSLGAEGFYQVGSDYRMFRIASMPIDMGSNIGPQINKGTMASYITATLGLEAAPLTNNDVEIIV